MELKKISKLLNQINIWNKSKKIANELYADQIAPFFNLFSFFPINELVISKCLAFLLDKNESHGQKDLFILNFYNKFDIPQKLQFPKKYYVHKEYRINNKRRLDILLSDNTRYIAIENKPWAEDKTNQLKDYGEFLHTKAKNNEHWLLIYLSNTIYSEASLPPNTPEHIKQNIIHLTFRELLKWLIDCSVYVKAPKIRLFVDELIKYIQEHINRESDMIDQNELTEKLLENLEAAFLIEKNVLPLKEALFKKFLAYINEQIADLNIKLKLDKDITKPNPGFEVKFEPNDSFVLRWEDNDNECLRLIYGILIRKKELISKKEIISKDYEQHKKIKNACKYIFKNPEPLNFWWPMHSKCVFNGMPEKIDESLWREFNDPKTSKFAKSVIDIIKEVYMNKEIRALLK